MAISRVIIRVTPFRALITLLITCLLSPLPLQVGALRDDCDLACRPLYSIWEFPKIRVTLFGGPYNKDPTI